MQTPTWCRERAGQVGPATAQFIERLLGDASAAPRLRSGLPRRWASSGSRRPAAEKKGGNEARAEG